LLKGSRVMGLDRLVGLISKGQAQEKPQSC